MHYARRTLYHNKHYRPQVSEPQVQVVDNRRVATAGADRAAAGLLLLPAALLAVAGAAREI